jgi:hypothetical protein
VPPPAARSRKTSLYEPLISGRDGDKDLEEEFDEDSEDFDSDGEELPGVMNEADYNVYQKFSLSTAKIDFEFTGESKIKPSYLRKQTVDYIRA